MIYGNYAETQLPARFALKIVWEIGGGCRAADDGILFIGPYESVEGATMAAEYLRGAECVRRVPTEFKVSGVTVPFKEAVASRTIQPGRLERYAQKRRIRSRAVPWQRDPFPS